MTLNSLHQYIESSAYLVAVIGGIPALISVLRQLNSNRKSLEEAVFNQLHEEYQEVLKIMLDRPELRVSWFSDDKGVSFSVEQREQRMIIFDIITSLFERTFLVYLDANKQQRDNQWFAWARFMADYANRDSYVEWWKECVSKDMDHTSQYDKRFEQFMDRLIASDRDQQKLVVASS